MSTDPDRRRRHERPASAQMVLQEPDRRLRGAGNGARRYPPLGSGLRPLRRRRRDQRHLDHLGLKGINTLAELARVKEVVPQSVLPDGAASSTPTTPTPSRWRGSPAARSSFSPWTRRTLSFATTCASGARPSCCAPTRHGEMITLIEHRRDTSLLLAEEIPATMEGRMRVNIQNAMAAAAAAFAQDVQLEYIRTRPAHLYLELLPDPRSLQPPRRSTDEGAPGLLPQRGRAGVDGRLRQTHGRRPHHRHDRDAGRPQRRRHRGFGRLAAGTFDEIVIREDYNPRGRRRGEVADLLKSAIAASGRSDGKVDIVLDEVEAAREAISRAARNDFVILMADRPALLFEHLTGRTS